MTILPASEYLKDLIRYLILFDQIFNTTGSTATIDRWKHKEADKQEIRDIFLESSSIREAFKRRE
jgi:hypothetical protein